MKFKRTVLPEELDSLGPDDPSAIRSRRDLQRVHRAMATCSVLARELGTLVGQRAAHAPPLRVLELGAGDASLMLRVARALKSQWPQVQLALLDQVDLLDANTRAAYAELGWTATPMTMNALDWASEKTEPSGLAYGEQPAWDLIVANLFLHHFEADDLKRLLAAIARSSNAFVACEPRRSRFALAASHCVGALGACSVTRSDAVTSVRAGFCDAELSALWPQESAAWALTECRAACFSHCFTARRLGAAAL